MAILISNKIDFKLKPIRRDGDRHFILITGTIHQEEVSILNIYAPNIKGTHICKRNTSRLKAVIKPHTLIVGDFNTLLSPMDRSIRQKPIREIRELMEVKNQMDLKDIYRTFHTNRKGYTFFTASHGTFLKIDHILGNKANFHRYKKNISNHLCLVRSPRNKVRIQ